MRKHFLSFAFIVVLPVLLVSWFLGMPTPMFTILLIVWCVTSIIGGMVA